MRVNPKYCFFRGGTLKQIMLLQQVYEPTIFYLLTDLVYGNIFPRMSYLGGIKLSHQ